MFQAGELNHLQFRLLEAALKTRKIFPFILLAFSRLSRIPIPFVQNKKASLIPIYILLGSLIFSNGCSRTDFLYSISGWAVLGKIRDYFELTERQEAFLTEKIDNIFEWHKKEELPKTVSFLKKFNDRFKNGLTEQELYAIGSDYDKLWDNLMAKALPEWSVFLESVNSDQIHELPLKLDKRNEFLEKKLKLTDSEWANDDSDWLIETLDDWVDGLSKEQILKIKSWIKPDRTFVEIRLTQRRSFHEWFVEELKANKTAKELEVSLSPWVIDPESVWSPAFKSQMEKKKVEWTKLMLNIDSILTQTQRNYAIEKIDSYISGFEKLFKLKQA